MKNLMTWAVALTTVTVGFTSCGVDMPHPTDSSFETMTVKKSDIELPYKFSARMKGQNDVTVTPQVSGQLMKICVTEGQQVKKGQPLFIIDSRNAQLELEAAQANLQAALAQENSAKLEYESNKNLFDKKIVSSYMLTNSENQYKQAQASVAQARASVNRAKVNLGFCTITANVSGIIGEIPVRVGDQVSPMSQLTMLSGNTTMYAEFSVTEAIVENMVKQGMKASDLDKFIAKLPEVTFVMKNGTDFAEKGVIIVPQYAVVRLQDKSQVYKVQADSTATAVEVTTADTGNGKEFIVTSGLNEGDLIVTTGANNVMEGQKVLFPAGAKAEEKSEE